ncbi:MAG: hypothetical protein KH028_01110 [Oscillospiraceae bacterium]|jgi:hypothetical protein|nr:hypothetical protein [Oscillospiraceae bacterium]
MKYSLLQTACVLSCAFLFGCAPLPNASNLPPSASSEDSIPFTDRQLYAVAHLGFQSYTDTLPFYAEHYLDNTQLPIHYFSSGDYYLVIPRYPDTHLSLYQNDINTSSSSLVYEEPDCRPFLIQCNISDIFPDATILLSSPEGTAEFSPFISLKDGSLEIGEYGLDLTDPAASAS